MSLLDSLAASERDELAGAAVREARMTRCRRLAERLPEGEREAALGGLALLDRHAEELAPLGGARLVGLLTKWQVGDAEGARLLYLRERAGFAELMAASSATAAKVDADRRQREAAWATVRDVLGELGALGLRVLPLLLTCL